jgi:hypothetical protein
VSDTKVKVVNNFPILGILGLIFITLKLTGVIGWSWWWVLSPFWIPVLVVAGILVFALVLALITSASSK